MPDTEQWREYLSEGLSAAQDEIALFSDYYAGHHRLQFATSKFREAFGELFEAFASSWCGLIVDVAVERLTIQGFRFGEDEADEEAWAIWQANSLDARSISAHTEAVKCGRCYLLVGPPRKTGEEPTITVEHPAQMIVAHDPADRTKRLAAMKWYVDDEGDHISVVYEPDKITTYKRELSPANAPDFFGVPATGDGANDWGPGTSEPNPLGIVPMIPLENNPGILAGGISDLAAAVPLNDAANKFFTDMIHASEFTAFPQRVLTGVEIPIDPVTGEEIGHDELRAAVSRLWTFEDPDTKVFDLAAGSLTNYVEGIDLSVQHMAAQTRTPPQYLLAKLANLSGEALIAAESGLVARVKRKMIDFAESWEEAMRLAFAWRAIDRPGWVGSDEDEARSLMDDAETIWVNPESRNPSVIADELVKKQQIGVPEEILWEEAGYTQQQIKRMRTLKDAEQAALAAQQGAGGTPGAAGRATITQAGGQLEIGGSATPAAPAPQPGQPGDQNQPQKPQQQNGKPPAPAAA